MLYILLKLKFNMHPSLCLSFTIDICTIPYQCGCYWVAAIQHPFHILRVPTKDIFTNTWGLHDQGWKVEWHVMWNILRPGPVTALGGVVSTEAFHCTTNWMQQKNLPITFSVEFKSCHWAICPLNATFCPCRWQADHCTIITFSFCNFDLRTGWKQSYFQS